jgi:PKHD-type hydroxylase
MNVWYMDQPKELNNWAWIDLFSKDQCDDIIALFDVLENVEGGTGDLNEKSDVRDSKVCWIPTTEEYSWIYRSCVDGVKQINNGFFNYDLDYIEQLQLTMYDSNNQFYGKHLDTLGKYYNQNRKLSFSILLTDPSEYEGGDLNFYQKETPDTPDPILGRMTAFPSHLLHEVTPVTLGKRITLVGWCCGRPLR